MTLIRTCLLLLALALPAQAATDIKEITSPGGITAWLVGSPDIPFTALEIRFRGGTSLDAPGKRGATNLMTALIEEGALNSSPLTGSIAAVSCGVVDGEDEARGGLLGLTLDADVEPDRTVEGGLLIHQDVLQIVAERLQIVFGRKVVLLARPMRDRVDDAADHLLDARLALRRGEAAAEVLLRDDVGGVQRPGDGELDAELFEGDGAVLPVVNARIALFPDHLVVWVHTWSGEFAADADGETLWCE